MSLSSLHDPYEKIDDDPVTVLTWEEIATAIAAMPPEQRKQVAHLLTEDGTFVINRVSALRSDLVDMGEGLEPADVYEVVRELEDLDNEDYERCVIFKAGEWVADGELHADYAARKNRVQREEDSGDLFQDADDEEISRQVSDYAKHECHYEEHPPHYEARCVHCDRLRGTEG